MRVITGKRGLPEFLGLLRKRGSGVGPAVEKAVRRILSDVQTGGDEAVMRYTRRFDGIDAKRPDIGAAEIRRAAAKADKSVLKALESAALRIRRFHERQAEKTWTFSSSRSVK